jgi:hypothetical protein
MTVGSLEAAQQLGVDWVGSPRPRPLPSQAAEISPSSEGRWLDRKAQAVQDRVEISDQGRNRAANAQVSEATKPERSVKPDRLVERPAVPQPREVPVQAVVQPVDTYAAQAAPVQVAASSPAAQVAQAAPPAVASPGKVSNQAISAYSQGARPAADVPSRVWIG